MTNMQLTLQITTGPHAGRKVLLRSGQVARIGRTEWADFSFPKDADLADVHFAVQCQLHAAKIRKLTADKPLTVNTKDVASEADLQSGDTIQAGQSAFVVLFDGQAKPTGASTTATLTTIAGGAFVAGGLAAAAADDKPKEPSALEIAETLQMSDDVKEVATSVKTGPELVARLAAKGQFAKAVRVQAHLLPKRHAVWWGIICVEPLIEKLVPPELTAYQAARTWVEEPTETHRRRCEAAAGRTKYEEPGSWLSMAAFWSGDSLTPADMPAVEPDQKLTGQAVTSSLMIASVFGEATQGKQRYQEFLAKAPKVASGEIPIPEKT